MGFLNIKFRSKLTILYLKLQLTINPNAVKEGSKLTILYLKLIPLSIFTLKPSVLNLQYFI